MPAINPPRTVNLADPTDWIAVKCAGCGHRVSVHDLQPSGVLTSTCRAAENRKACDCTISYITDPRTSSTPQRPTCPGCGHGYGYHDDVGCHHVKWPGTSHPIPCRCTRTGVSLHSGQSNDDWPTAAEFTANAVNVVQLVRDLTNPDECWYDHHGYCLTHGWLKAGECPHARAKRLLRSQP